MPFNAGSKLNPLIRALESTLSLVGQVSVVPVPQSGGVNILLGMESLLSRTTWPRLPAHTIIFNGTPVGSATSTRHFDYLINHPVIDVSESNAQALQRAGNAAVAHLPIRYHKELVYRRLARRSDLDVLIVSPVGATDRARVLTVSLRERGLLVESAVDDVGIFGEPASRAGVVVVLRQQADGLPYLQAVMMLAASGICVLAEEPADTLDRRYFSEVVTFARYEELVELTCRLAPTRTAQAVAPRAVGALAEDLLEKRVLCLSEFLLSASENTVGGPATISLLGMRKAVVAGTLKLPMNALPAIDYALGWHDRALDVEDSFHGAERRVESLPLILLLEMYVAPGLPESIRSQLALPIVSRVAEGGHDGFSERGKMLAALVAARLGDLACFLRVLATASDPISMLACTLPGSAFVGLEVFDGVQKMLRQGDFVAGTAEHVAAELLWHAGQESAAVDQYLAWPARRAAGEAGRDFQEKAAARLAKYGNKVGALTYATLADRLTEITPEGNVAHQLPEMTDSATLQDMSLALQRCDSFANSRIDYLENGISIDSSSQLEANLILDGDLKIWDARFARSVSTKRDAKAVAIIACYNEVDLIEAVVNSFRKQGVRVHLMDNWSSDGTWELAKLMEASDDKIVVEKFPPDQPAAAYNWRDLLSRKEDVALLYPDHWVFHSDADEIRTTPWDEVNLAKGLAVVEDYGFNAVDFLILNFRPVDQGFKAGIPPEEYFAYYELGDSPDLKYQIKCWKQGSQKANLTLRGGHSVIVPDKKVFPIKFICKHYPIRSVQHAERKIIRDRRARFSSEELAMGWHTQYDQIKPADCAWDWTSLTRFTTVSESSLSRHLIYGL